ncbi:MAG: hypothetical protein OEY17_05870 [Nitrosopumilus sp.]|nr:hypothetical protein [Nitrosopumilus sp.]MDH5658850.1 hypothetical protein [Nitrosopumilus sp.]
MVEKKVVKKTQKKIIEKTPAKKTSKAEKDKPGKSSKAIKSKTKKIVDDSDAGMGIVIVDDDIHIDQEKVNEERRAYLEEARSQEAYD